MNENIYLQIHQTIAGVLGNESEFVALHEPFFCGNEWSYVKECINTGWVSSVGKYVDAFEEHLADFTGARFAVAVSNGTSALHICLKLVDVQPNDEVLIPTLTFVATANAVMYCGAIPHFVDSCDVTLGIDVKKLDGYLKKIAVVEGDTCLNRKTGRVIRAIIPMHTYGHPVDLDDLIEVCNRYSIEIVEDAAEALGSYYKGQHLGNFGKVSALSFNGNKIITTGGGGAILTKDEHLAKRAKHITTTAKIAHKWSFVHDEVGYNYRMPNINAALGCAQLEKLPEFIRRKRGLAEQFKQAFEFSNYVRFMVEPEYATSNYWLNVLLLKHESAEQLESVIQYTNDNGIMTRPVWQLMHQLVMYKDCPRMDLSQAESLQNRIICIPSSASLIK